MKNKLFFIVALLAIILVNLVSIKSSKSEETPGELRWKKYTCFDGVTTYEICFYGGDGNKCSPWGTKTRECPSNPN